MWQTIKEIRKVFLSKIKSGSINIHNITGSNKWRKPKISTGFCSFVFNGGQTFIDKTVKKRDDLNYDVKLFTAKSVKQPARSIAQQINNAKITIEGSTKTIINTSFRMYAKENLTNLSLDVYIDGQYKDTIVLKDIGYTDYGSGIALNIIYYFRFVVATSSLKKYTFEFKNIKQTNYNVKISEFYVNSVEEYKPDYNNEIISDIILYVHE